MLTQKNRKRLALTFGVAGVGFMGADLLITRNIFVHIAELMAASIACFILALLIDRGANQEKERLTKTDSK